MKSKIFRQSFLCILLISLFSYYVSAAEIKMDEKTTKALNTKVTVQYDSIGQFNNGRAYVTKDDKFTYIDMNGKEIMPLREGKGWPFSEGLAKIGEDEVNTNTYSKFTYIDTEGKEIMPFFKGYGTDFHEGVGVIAYYEDDENEISALRFKFIDESGKQAVPGIYRSATPFKDDMAVVGISGGLRNGGGLFDETEKIIINKFGEEVMPYKKDNLTICRGWDEWPFLKSISTDFLIPVENDDGKHGYIDKNWNVVVPVTYEGVTNDFQDGFVEVKITDDKYSDTFIANSGKQLPIPEEYSYRVEDGYVNIDNNIYASTGDIVFIQPPQYRIAFIKKKYMCKG